MPPTLDVTPGQATYVIERLLAERRLTTNDITRYLNDLQHEITTIETRLAILHAATPHPTRSPAHTTTQPSTPSNTTRTTSKRDQQQIASNTIASNTPASNTVASNTAKRRKRQFSPAIRAQQQLQGRYMGYLRQLPSHLKPRFHAIKGRDGIGAAITALRQHLGK
jgi:hypothetical protein